MNKKTAIPKQSLSVKLGQIVTIINNYILPRYITNDKR